MQAVDKIRKSREIVGANARKLKEQRGNPSEMEIEKHGGPKQRTTNRLLNGKNANLDSVDDLARYFGVQAWQLMVPDMNITHAARTLPTGKPLTKAQESLLKAYEDAPPHVKDGINSLLRRKLAVKSIKKGD